MLQPDILIASEATTLCSPTAQKNGAVRGIRTLAICLEDRHAKTFTSVPR